MTVVLYDEMDRVRRKEEFLASFYCHLTLHKGKINLFGQPANVGVSNCAPLER